MHNDKKIIFADRIKKEEGKEGAKYNTR